MAGAKRSKGATKKKSAAKKKVAAKKKAVAKTKALPAKKKTAVKKAGAKKKAVAKKKAAPKKAAPKKAATKKKTAAVAKKKAAPKKAATKKKTAAVAKKKAAPKKAVAKKKRPSLGVTRRKDSFRPIDDEAPTVEIPTPHTERSPRSRSDSDAIEPSPTSASVPTVRPSERMLAVVSEMPTERALTAEESEAMSKVAETARKVIEAVGDPGVIVTAIAAFLEEVRLGKREEPKSQDVRLGLGVLWGEQLRSQVGWTWVHLTYPDGFASYALVPEDRAFACFPLNRVPEALRGNGTSTSAHVFESIREGALPTRKERTYLVIG